MSELLTLSLTLTITSSSARTAGIGKLSMTSCCKSSAKEMAAANGPMHTGMGLIQGSFVVFQIQRLGTRLETQGILMCRLRSKI